MSKDKVIIKITLERNLNGTVNIQHSIQGEGIHFFEIVGLMQIAVFNIAKMSTDTAKIIPDDKDVRMVYPETEHPSISDVIP